ncbi:fructose-bisphosphate aldolase [Claveliimonas bilis]|uniref:class II fructose-bisphosphate aldolase n=1 Tax=Claveliimonas bilis TaxID=3028070 RepID=UPI001E49CD92|nr:class II fructose-bisphosphate aldolase [Claveliimonas bilis]BCZ27651.1 fructose-bisphosphate aldolase [Claveliimonas bilis]BDZ83660.1 fructose-bisphosphate aldolase [Claveliimonas bilis]
MLVTLREVLKDAKEKKYGVGLFNTVNLEMTKGVIQAAEELSSPVIIGTAEVLLPYAELEELAYFMVPMAKKASVPVVLHFDHGVTEQRIMEALKLGYTSVMYDCSTDTYENNVKRVADMVKTAETFGASVEAELGHVGANEGNLGKTDAEDDSIYTQPEQAKDFAKRTNVDALAVAIGTAHGAYKEKPRLDIGRLAEISRTIETPLVLHGGSGLSDDDFRNCVANGITKINIFTDINCIAAKAAYENYREGLGQTNIQNQVIEAVKQETMKKMKVFGSVNRA